MAPVPAIIEIRDVRRFFTPQLRRARRRAHQHLADTGLPVEASRIEGYALADVVTTVDLDAAGPASRDGLSKRPLLVDDARDAADPAIAATLAHVMHRLATEEKLTAWDGEFEPRSGLTSSGPDSLSHQLQLQLQGMVGRPLKD